MGSINSTLVTILSVLARRVAGLAIALVVLVGCGSDVEQVGNAESPLTPSVIYDEALASGWTTSWSWSSSITVGSTTKAYSGTRSIAWRATSAWGGLYLHSDSGINTTGYDTLSFAAYASQSSKLALQLYDANNRAIGSQIVLSP